MVFFTKPLSFVATVWAVIADVVVKNFCRFFRFSAFDDYFSPKAYWRVFFRKRLTVGNTTTKLRQ